MGYNIAVVKTLWNAIVTKSVCTVLKVVSCDDIEHAKSLTAQIAINDAKLSYGDKYIGVVNTEALATLQNGDYALTVDSHGVYCIWYIENKIVEGWFVNGAETTPVEIGRISFETPVDGVVTEDSMKIIETEQKYLDAYNQVQKLEKQLDHYKVAFNCEQDRADQLGEKLLETEELLGDSRRSTISRADECRKMMLEVEKFRKNADKDLTMLQELTTELSELKRQLYEKDLDIASLRENAMYSTRGSNTPMKTSTVLATPEYDEVIARIKAFDKSRLLSRKERDQLLKEKKSK